MFIFDEGPRSSRRFGLPAVIVLLLITGVLIFAVRWHPEPLPATADATADPRSCTPGTLRSYSVSGGPVDIRALRDAILKSDAERAVKRASGVDQVINQIEELPASTNDDELRWKLYYKIYRDPFLSRYAPGGGMLWGHRHGFGGFSTFDSPAFPGMEPAGDYPIHIIVKNGRVSILGVVDNATDKSVVTMRAREVPGTFAVENNLIVESRKSKKP